MGSNSRHSSRWRALPITSTTSIVSMRVRIHDVLLISLRVIGQQRHRFTVVIALGKFTGLLPVQGDSSVRSVSHPRDRCHRRIHEWLRVVVSIALPQRKRAVSLDVLSEDPSRERQHRRLFKTIYATLFVLFCGLDNDNYNGDNNPNSEIELFQFEQMRRRTTAIPRCAARAVPTGPSCVNCHV